MYCIFVLSEFACQANQHPIHTNLCACLIIMQSCYFDCRINKPFTCSRWVICVSCSVHLTSTYTMRKGSWAFFNLNYSQICDVRKSDHVSVTLALWQEPFQTIGKRHTRTKVLLFGNLLMEQKYHGSMTLIFASLLPLLSVLSFYRCSLNTASDRILDGPCCGPCFSPSL